MSPSFNPAHKLLKARLGWAASGEMRRLWVSRTIELVREHPVFELPSQAAGAGVAARDHFSPSERERAWKRETLRLFQQRLALLTMTALGCLPLFWLMAAFFAPSSRVLVTQSYLLVAIGCGLTQFLARRIASLWVLRGLIIGFYAMFAATAAAVMSAAHSPVVAAFSGHGQLLVSLIFMPLAWGEAGFCVLLIVASFGLGLWHSMVAGDLSTVVMRTASLGLTGSIIVVMSHLQRLMRRSAFDSAFDMALSANNSAALSNLDVVTGGFNRRHLLNMLELELSRAARFEQPLAFLMFDLDNFKIVNDTYGHPAGDEVLREVMSATVAAVRGIDTAARYGGDEFAVVLPTTNLADAISTAERLKEQVYAHLRVIFPPQSPQSRVELSLGVACFAPGEAVRVEDAIARADACLYQAKRAGKNTVFAEK